MPAANDADARTGRPGVSADASRTADELLHGAIDIHMHTAPDVYPRSVTADQAAANARAAGMAAIGVKSHSTDTTTRAEYATRATGLPVYGGVTLNYPVGGLNPHAVLESARQGGVFVWMPTTSARHFLSRGHDVGSLAGPVPVHMSGLVLGDNDLLPQVEEVLRIVAEHDLVLCSGHVSPTETLMLFARARQLGIGRLVATHPHAAMIGMSVSQMQEAAELGALIEFLYAFATDAVPPPQRVADWAETIRAVGVEHCVLATDGGQSINPPPDRMFHRFIAEMLDNGFTDREIRQMTATAPAQLLADRAAPGAHSPPVAARA